MVAKFIEERVYGNRDVGEPVRCTPSSTMRGVPLVVATGVVYVKKKEPLKPLFC